MRKEYKKPEVEFISLISEEKITTLISDEFTGSGSKSTRSNDNLDGSMGLGDSDW